MQAAVVLIFDVNRSDGKSKITYQEAHFQEVSIRISKLFPEGRR